MKILITGAIGQLGTTIIGTLKGAKNEIGIIDSLYKNANIIELGKDELDIAKFNDVQTCINGYKPEIIINTAAYTNVDSCEVDQDNAFKVNSLGPRNLAIASERVGAKFIHISTDYVFSGEGSIPYREYDKTNPINVYGKTKLAGENYVREFCSKYFIIRTSWLYGYNGNNFIKTILKASQERDHLEVVNDQRGNPTHAEDLVYHILKVALTDEYGIYHCTANGECSWYDFAQQIIKFAGIKCEVSPITSSKLNRIAKRPALSSLDNMMLRCTIGDEMRGWEEALRKYIEKIRS